jgi:hypothetical protein
VAPRAAKGDDLIECQDPSRELREHLAVQRLHKKSRIIK